MKKEERVRERDDERMDALAPAVLTVPVELPVYSSVRERAEFTRKH